MLSDHQVEGVDALEQLRRVRRHRGQQDANPFDSFYRLYVTGLGGLFGFYLALGLVDEVEVGQGGIDWAATNSGRWVALVAAVALAVGARSGANGGPLAIDDLELHHVLLSPISRKISLRLPAFRMIALSAGIGVVLGAAAGELASRQLPGRQAAWVLSGLLVAALVAVSAVGAAFVTSGANWSRRWVMAGSLVLPTWAVVDLVLARTTSPTSGFGFVAMLPFDTNPLALTAVAVSVLLVGLGWRWRGSISMERAHHRSRLVAQIRFAFAQQDIRSLLLLRRQLGFETPRSRPWFTIKGGGRIEQRVPVLVRDARSYARWPLARATRVALLMVVAGLSLGAMWRGTTALIVVAAIAIYLAAIETIEPLSQELDHPGMLELIPIVAGRVVLMHVLSGILAMTVVWLGIGGIAALASLDWQISAAVSIAALPAASAAVAAAALSIRRFDSPSMTMPEEVEGPRMILRLLWPPALTLFGTIPVLVARNAAQRGDSVIPPAINLTVIVAIVAAIAVSWIRFRDEVISATANFNPEAP